jgi:hypothetical protein
VLWGLFEAVHDDQSAGGQSRIRIGALKHHVNQTIQNEAGRRVSHLVVNSQLCLSLFANV